MEMLVENQLVYAGLPLIAVVSGEFAVKFLWEAVEDAQEHGRPFYHEDKFIVSFWRAVFTLIVGWPAIRAWLRS